MHLSKITLSGFKSFVDPISFSLSSNLTGIVGPNGCGKSNIIDALSWVLGECSARQLRGEHLVDVIFNGSSQRKALGQASVELIFDNSARRAGGQYAAWSEIAIRRQITRDGISSYFLNGTRCRRRDIVSLFLGTGLGAGGYAIIEQGTISSVIEARPEGLRGYIEEAAGISKYRQRRREAENRMRHTQENLLRVNDIVAEIDSRLGELDRQAEAAGKFQALKQQEKQLRLECLALSWQTRREALEQCQEKVQRQEAVNEARQQEKAQLEAQLEQAQEQLRQANQTLNEQQAGSYRISSELVQGEQSLQYGRQRISETEANLAQTEQQQRQARREQQADAGKIADITARLQALQPQAEAARRQCEQARTTLNKAERGWQKEWQDWRRNEKQRQGISARLDALRDEQQRNAGREQRLTEEGARLADPDLVRERDRQQARYRELQQQWQKHELACKSLQKTVRQEQVRLAQLGEQLQQHNSHRHTLSGQLSALETLQGEQAGRQTPELQQWLNAQGLADSTCLMERVRVAPDWAHAFETVAGPFLQHLCVEQLETLLPALPEDRVGLVAPLKDTAHSRQRRLIDQLQGPAYLPAWLATVYIADDLPEALRIQKTLAAHESVVSRQGVWLGQNWLLVATADQESGMLGRQQAMEKLQQELREIDCVIEATQQDREQVQERLRVAEKQYTEQQSRLGQSQTLLAELAAELASTRTRIEHNQKRSRQISEELGQLRKTGAATKQELAALEKRLAHMADSVDDEPRTAQDDAVQQARSRWQNSQQDSDALSLQIDTLNSQKAVLAQAEARMAEQLDQLNQRAGQLQSALQQEREPLPGMEQAMKEKQAAREQAEALLNKARETLHALQEQVRALEQQRQQQEKDCQQQALELQQAQLEHREQQVKWQAVADQLAEAQAPAPEALLSGLAANADAARWQAKLARVQQRIESMSTVNLGAIGEFEQLRERKDYLDAQRADLEQALAILQTAITRLDRETRNRFQQTFARINDNLAQTFPRLFAGGHCKLELTGDDLLTAGVRVTARPPGKRASTIHLLSGGEKALTAIALVFAIFRINPAPFCILDEVDAPLDDHNASRFSDMLVSLSEDIQFLFVTHNKITMEIAERLIGVTMQESGVSRLVAVDMEQAAPVAASA